MKRVISIFSFCLICGISFGGNSFYVWQQLWSSNVVNAVVSEPKTTIYPIVTVVPNRGKSRMVRIPWDKLSATEHCVVPVIRIPLKAFNRSDIEEELVRVAGTLSRFSEIQLDLDCPERRLGEYLTLLQGVRSKILQDKLSITVLPCHLNNRIFEALAKETDYYVLQVHGLSVPDYIDDPAELMNLAVAEKAIDRAEKLEHPYSIALPCYAYELNFDPDSGKFLFLAAEGSAHRQNTKKRRISAKQNHLIQLVEQFKRLKYAQDLIWFRLPVRGDRLCLPRIELKMIESGVVPDCLVTCEIEPISSKTMELSIYNSNTIHASSATIRIGWDQPFGAYDLYEGVDSSSLFPGRFPEELSVLVPAPGQSIKIGWFSTTNPPHITLRLQ